MKKNTLKELKIKATLYRYAACVLAGGGFVVFIMLYIKIFEGDIMALLRNPSLIVFSFFSFLPAAIMAYLSERLYRQASHKSVDKRGR